MDKKKRYTCAIVDDNELDRLALASHLSKYSFVLITAQFSSPLQILEWMDAEKLPDVLFLDIDMPEMNGLDLRRKLQRVPACIFVTAHPEFALESFEMDVLDYLVKPLKASRFEKAMLRLQHFLELREKAEVLDCTLGEGALFIKDGHTHIRLLLHDIIYLEALKDYTGIVTAQKKHYVLKPLGTLLAEKEFRSFIRIHRSYAVQKHFLTSVSPAEVIIDGTPLPIGRKYKETLRQMLSE